MADPTIADLDKKLDVLVQAVAGLKERIAEQREETSRQTDELGRRVTVLEQADATRAVSFATLAGQIQSVQAVVAERETDRRTTPPWVAVAALLVAGASSVAAIIIPVIN